ncbi:MAG: hypothetical protein OXU66_01500 [Gammaproteobacteria bacterium]|nr:hypothetical protein [Gammaproteobacteria bacterium]MDD9895393.1 hypothetical protein [Gammaproteobacteria bacterium]MDD9957590.1 hypothetical protein [Gammaproteobacteria bacterium]
MKTLEEFIHLLEIHGADRNKWPDELRQDIESLLAEDESAFSIFNEYALLEHRLDEIVVPEFPNLEQRVLNQELPARAQSITDQLLNWLIPTENLTMRLWRPAMAACLPLVFGIVLGNFYSFGVNSEIDELDYWDDELALLAMSAIPESEAP